MRQLEPFWFVNIVSVVKCKSAYKQATLGHDAILLQLHRVVVAGVHGGETFSRTKYSTTLLMGTHPTT